MKREPSWRRYLRFWGPDPASDIDDELHFHLETKIDHLMASGLKPGEARREALRQFGPIRPVRNECYAISKGQQVKTSRAEYFMGWLRDLKHTVRYLTRTKTASLAVIFILAVGIGANTAIFTLLDRLMFRPLPVPKPSQLVLVSKSDPGRPGNQYFRIDAFMWLRDRNRTFNGLAAEAFYNIEERRLGTRIDRKAEGIAVSGNFFEVLGRPPLLGRTLAPADEVTSATSHVAVLSYRFWERRYDRAPDVLGQTVYLRDLPFTIVGVMPRGFFGTHQGYDPDLYVPLHSLRELFGFDALSAGTVAPIGRLRAGITRTAAESELQMLWDQFPASRQQERRIDCEDGSSGHAGTGGEKQRSLILLAGIVALLLLMASVNVACLLIARGAARLHEIAIRLSLGAGRARILRQSLLESTLLALAGGTAGLVGAVWADRLLLIAFQWKNRPIDVTPDWRVAAFGFGLSVAIGLLFGLGPALQSLRGCRMALNQERTVAPRFAAGKVLVIAEVALSLIMVAGATVFIRSFQNLRSVPTGFVADHVSVIRLSTGSDSESLNAPVYEAVELEDSLAGTPGIESAALADLVTFNDARVQYILRVPSQNPSSTHVLRVDGSYFHALRIPLVAGRTFTRHDDERAPMVAILTEGTAQRLFPGESSVGRRIILGRKDQVEVVGVVKDIKVASVAAPAPELLFLPLLQGESHSRDVKLQVRSRMSIGDVAALVRSRIRDAHLPLHVEAASALEDEIGASLLNDRLRMQFSTLFGALALLLIAAGVYGLMAYSVVRRTREIGVRMAVGSSSASIIALVLRDSLRLLMIGVALGLPGAFAVMKAISSMVFGLSPADPVSLGAAVLLLAATGFAATALPACRAAHIDPVQALRVQ